MKNNTIKKEINKRLNDDLWDIKIAKNVIGKRKAIKNRNIKAVSSLVAACFVATIVYGSLFFKTEPNQGFITGYYSDQIIMDDIISLLDETELDITFSQDIDVIIELAINSRF